MTKGGTMHVHKGRASRHLRVVSLVALITAMLVLGAAGQGARDHSSAGGFRETYKAKTSMPKKALFRAKLLPTNKMARDISVAFGGRSGLNVNLTLALKCWKN